MEEKSVEMIILHYLSIKSMMNFTDILKSATVVIAN